MSAAFGVNLATTQLATSVPLSIDLAGTTVRVRDSAGVERLASLFFVSGGQINYQLPPGTALGAATITIASGDGTLSTGTVNVTAVAPGAFSAASSASGVAAAYIVRVKNDNSTVDELISRYDHAQQKFVAIPIEFTPETRDIVLVLFGTGWRGRSALPAVGVKIGGVDVPVAYAGTQGWFRQFGSDEYGFVAKPHWPRRNRDRSDSRREDREYGQSQCQMKGSADFGFWILDFGLSEWVMTKDRGEHSMNHRVIHAPGAHHRT